MSNLFKACFGTHQGFENVTVYDFIPYRARVLDLFFRSTRKQAFFVLIWWASGAVVVFATFKLLEVLLISP